MESLAVDYPKNDLLLFSVVPPPSMMGGDVVSFMNNVLSSQNKELCSMDVWVDNEALYRVCKSHYGIESPSFADINKLVVGQASSMTSARRFGGPGNNFSFREVYQNLIPYPRMMMFSTARPTPASQAA